MTTPVPVIDENGLYVPDFSTFKSYLETQYRGTYGSDIVLTPDTQDGNIVGILALAMSDTAAAIAAAYAARSPIEAKGVGLSSLVKVNGLEREASSYSTVDLTLVGQAQTKIIYGAAKDQNGFVWALPSIVTIPDSGQITVTATCQIIGAIQAATGTVTIIATTTAGWQTVINNSDATVGATVETDAQLRLRQADASGLPSQTALDGLVAGVANVAGVTRYKVYVNDQGYMDANGIPGHSTAVVVDGGTLSDIANVLLLKKGQGLGFYGDTTQTITDTHGIPNKVAFSRSRSVAIGWEVGIKPLSGFTYATQDDIKAAVLAYTNTFGIAQQVMTGRAYSVVNPISDAFELVSIRATRNGGEPKPGTIDIAYNERAVCNSTADITVIVLRNEVPGL